MIGHSFRFWNQQKTFPIQTNAGLADNQPAPPLTPEQTELENLIRAWRKSEAAATGKPAFFVLTDAALKALAVHCPQTLNELIQIHGIGPIKAERYGAAIIALCRQPAT